MSTWLWNTTIAVTLLLALWEFAPLRNAGMVYQDHNYQTGVENGPAPAVFVPRSITRWVWYYEVRAGHSPAMMHATNLAIHLLVSIAVGALALRMGMLPVAAYLAGCVMLLNPFNSEAVGYLSGRGDLMATLTVVTACIVAIGPMVPWRIALLVVMFPIAIMCKEAGIALLVLVPLVRKQYVVVAVMLGVIAGICYAAGPGPSPGDPVWSKVFYTPSGMVYWASTQLVAAFRLLDHMIVPFPELMTIDYDDMATGVSNRVIFAGFAILVIRSAWRARSESSKWSLVAFWVAAVVLPRLVVVTPLSTFNQHQAYMAMPGVAIAIASALTYRSA